MLEILSLTLYACPRLLRAPYSFLNIDKMMPW